MNTQDTQHTVRTRSARAGDKATQPASVGSKLVDWIVFIIVLGISVITIVSMLPALGMGAVMTQADVNTSWYLVRATGLTAYTLLATSTVWGLFLTSRIIADWSPGPMSMLFHATTSWLAVVLSIAHAALLLFDTYYTYTIADLVVPFIGPYRPIVVGLGIIGAWLTLAITISFSIRKLMGNRAWRWLHYTSYLTFAMVTAHSVLAGTDTENPGTRIMYVVMSVIVVVLLWRRLVGGRTAPKSAARSVEY